LPTRDRPEPKRKDCSFLKKRTKNFLSVSASTELTNSNAVPTAMDKSFLLLFFKKEVLPFLP